MGPRPVRIELEELGFGLSYEKLTRNIRGGICVRTARPVHHLPNVQRGIPHAPGDETQWDWLESPDPPEFWGWGKTAHLLVG